MNSKINKLYAEALYAFAGVAIPICLARAFLGFGKWDLTVPLLYGSADHIWQLALNKALFDTGWVLSNPFLGAPAIASWHHNAAAQTSALHSVLELVLKPFVRDAVHMQQLYYFLNFPLITLITFYSCRLLGISALPAFSAGILFSFTRFRIDEMLYTYLPNYFCIPLMAVATIWIAEGKFKRLFDSSVEETSIDKSRRRGLGIWLTGLLFVFITGVADGYYGFFGLMLLGFSLLFRAAIGDWRNPKSLLPGLSYIFVLLATAITLQVPLNNYKNTHREEFFPHGAADPVYIKKPFEAEVYASSLKLLIAPNQHHRINALADAGKEMVASSDDARKFERGNYWPLGLLGSIALIVVFFKIVLPKNFRSTTTAESELMARKLVSSEILTPLIFFSFLASIAGGIGTIVALLFPTIRAYDRFAAYLFLFLLIWVARYASTKLTTESRRKRIRWTVLILFTTTLALLDQIPADSYKGNETTKARFIAERTMVAQIESALPINSMIYQYPYSQYLTDNKYYGWGSFSHIRLYLHSKALRWSNGGAKNSPADNWNLEISKLPFEDLLTEVAAVGFKGIVIDRTVVRDDEFARLLKILSARRLNQIDDKASGLVFIKLNDPGYVVTYAPRYEVIDAIHINQPAVARDSKFPRLIEEFALREHLNASSGEPTNISRILNPTLFVDPSVFTRGVGLSPILPLTDMLGSLHCAQQKQSDGGNAVVLQLTNSSKFDWKLGEGNFPIGIGSHIKVANGKMLRWDNGYRAPFTGYIKKGATQTLTIPFSSLSLSEVAVEGNGGTLELQLVQDANAWFNAISCAIKLE